MTKYLIVVLAILISTQISAQGFSDLGGAEKVWVLFHPFSVNKAKKISKKALAITDSVSNQEAWLRIDAGGRKDAFRHGIWMAMMASEIGLKRALWLGKAHEKKNTKDFEKGNLEDGAIPDKKSVEMDLFNNQIGVNIGSQNKKTANDKLIQFVLNSLKQGEFRIIKMDENGNSIDSLGNIIPRETWEGEWENARILRSSN